jgi:hypothetical protein
VWYGVVWGGMGWYGMEKVYGVWYMVYGIWSMGSYFGLAAWSNRLHA